MKKRLLLLIAFASLLISCINKPDDNKNCEKITFTWYDVDGFADGVYSYTFNQDKKLINVEYFQEMSISKGNTQFVYENNYVGAKVTDVDDMATTYIANLDSENRANNISYTYPIYNGNRTETEYIKYNNEGYVEAISSSVEKIVFTWSEGNMIKAVWGDLSDTGGVKHTLNVEYNKDIAFEFIDINWLFYPIRGNSLSSIFQLIGLVGNMNQRVISRYTYSNNFSKNIIGRSYEYTLNSDNLVSVVSINSFIGDKEPTLIETIRINYL